MAHIESGASHSREVENANKHLDEQQTLLEGSLPLVFAAYDQGIAARTVNPVVILLDCEDSIGQEVARAWLGDEAVDVAIGQVAAEQVSAGDQTTVFAYGFAWEACKKEIPAIFPYLAPVFKLPPPQDGILAISVTSGGASALTVPWSARD